MKLRNILGRKDMLKCVLCKEAPCDTACPRQLEPAVRLRSIWFEDENVAALSLPEAESVSLDGLNAEITFLPAKTDPARLIARLAEACSLVDLTVEAPDIERLVADMYEEMAL